MTEPAIRSELGRGTLGRLLRARAVERPHQVAFTFLPDGEVEAERLTYAGLDARARAVAAALRESVPPGERALLLFPPGLDFVAAFFGCLYAGVVAVPAYPPRPNDRSQSRLRSIAWDAEPRAALTTSAILAGVEGARGLFALAPELSGLRWIPTDTLPDASLREDFPEPDPDAIAFLQYTSGSTAAPKGVMVTHANLLHNERMIGAAFEQDEDSVVVGWLPLYHDMGLIGNVLQPLHAGAQCVLMSPVAFLQKPLRWLAAISRYQGTTSGGPNFAYELCARRIGLEDRAGLDLSSWRVAFNGAEPVRAGTLERFAEAFAPCGFRSEAFYPCYGLAEATLFVTGGVPGRRPRVAEGPSARRLVSCGRTWMGQRVVIADPEAGTEQPPDVEGEVWVSGPSVARGYWRRDEETARDFNAFLLGSGEGEGPFLRTGDLGFLRDGELFVTGRLKDLIILRGRNHYPQDVELTAERSHPDLRPGNGAAFSVEIEGEERLVVVHEMERRRREDLEEVAEAVRRAVAEEHDVQVYEVVLIRAGSLPKTSSGKVQRRLCRELYLRGELAVVGRSALAGLDAALGSGLALTRGSLAALELDERRAMLETFLRERAAAALRTGPGSISPEQPLTGLGLDSLAAVELRGSVETALGLEVPLADLLQGAGVRALAERLLAHLEAAPEGAGVPPLRAVSLEGDQPLSSGEKALWFLHRLAPEGGAYNIAVAARVRGLDPAALERAMRTLVARHESLQTVFPLVGDGPVRRVLPALEIDVQVEDASGWSERELADRLGVEAWRPFTVETGPLLRLRLFDRPDGERVLLFAIHHLVADFWSLGVVARELAVLYDQTADLAPLPLRVADVVHWEEETLAGLRGERLWRYWRERLDGVPDLDLPTDRPRPPVQTYRGGARAAVLPPSLAEVVRALGAARGATLFMTLLAAFQALLARWAGQEDFAMGSPTAGRPVPEMAGLVGYFVNPVALRADLSGDPAFADHLDRVRQKVLEGLEHTGFPFALLAERLRPVRDPARSPIFQTMFVLQRGRPQDDPGLAAFALGEEGARVSLGGLVLQSVRLEERRAQVDLALRLAETPGGDLLASLEFNTDLFDPSTAEGMLRQLRSLLAGVVEEPARRVGELPWMEEAEVRQVLGWSAGPHVGTAPQPALHELVREQAEKAPGVTALVWDGGGMTYGELAARARSLAFGLRRLGVGPDIVVGLLAERSPEMVVGMLGVLEAGGAWLPLDPESPRERLAAMLEDSCAPMSLAPRRLLDVLPSFAGRVLALEDLEAEKADLPRVDGDNLAYVIFTSGSTGRPKGVAVPHRAVVNRLLRAREAFAIGPSDAMLQRAPFGFDVSVWEVFGPLVSGGRVVLLPPGGHRDPAAVTRALTEGVTLANFTPSALDVLLDQEGLAARASSLRQVFVGAEALTVDLRDRFFTVLRRPPLTNMYGPTEAAVDLAWHTCRPEDGARVPIGRPIPGCTAYVLDAFLAAVPPGVPGEVWLGGEALARGYLGRPDLTAERFLPNPFGDGERLYRTGDLARWLPEGILELLGRVDEQIKIRGVRIEPGEVEAALRRQTGVREAAVLSREDATGGRRLVAYVAAPSADPRALRAALAEALPEAMIPTAYVPVLALPRTPTGKIDRRALARMEPEPEHSAASGGGGVPPRTPVEELLAGLWAELLGVERIGVHDDFFELGGHSLLATRVVARVSRVFGVDLPVSSVFQAPTVARLAEKIAAVGEASPASPLRPFPRDGGPLPLSFAQSRLWLLDRIEPGNPAYNVPGAVRLSGSLDIAALAASLTEIARRHEALRTVFRTERGRPVQVVRPAEGRLPLVDLGTLPSTLRESEAERLTRLWATAPFDLARGPLQRTLVLRLAPGEHVLAITLHHIVADGWSLAVLLGELASLYGALTAGRPSPLPPLLIQYADWASWQREYLRGDVLERQLAWWRERLAGVPVLEVPADRPRPPVRGFRGGSRLALLPPGLSLEIERLARREGVTLFMALLAAFQALLARTTAEDSIPVGSPVANRGRVEAEGLIGFFVNTLVLATHVGDDPPFRDLLARAREVCLGAYAHQDLPFERLVEELRPERHLSQNPLFQVVFLLEEPLPVPQLGDLAAEVRRVETGTAKFDLTLVISPGERGFAATLEYDAALFDPATADRLLGHWRTLLEGIAADPETRISVLPLLTPGERSQLLAEWNETSREYPCGLLHQLFEARTAQAPEAEAVAAEGVRLTYQELNRRANRLARRLRRLGVVPESRVALAAERSLEMIVGILGILKAGGAYVPLDPSYPEERLAYIREDSRALVLLTRADLTDPSLENESGDDLESLAHPDNAAYVIYTSGSTGNPKGTVVTHRNVTRLFAATDSWFGFGPGDVWTLFHSFAFDFSVWEIWGALTYGGRLVVVPYLVSRTPGAFLDLLLREEVTVLNQTPSAFRQLVHAEGERGSSLVLRLVVFGGEALDLASLAPWLERHGDEHPRLVNMYGITETTVHVSYLPITRADLAEPWRSPVGVPIPDLSIHILDPHGRPVPIGVPGEIHVEGAGLARGYLGRPDLTAERYVPNPFTGFGERLYRSGDLARWRPGGEIDYLGRIDRQVKIRGFRIEPAEIEAALSLHPEVREASVVVRDDLPGGKGLVGYVAPALPADLRDFLRARLPEPMVPAFLASLPELPLTPNGKVDRGALARRGPVPGRTAAPERAAPRTPLEEKLAGIWSEVLRIEEIGVHDNFFELGGHSLLAVQVLSRIGEGLGVDLPLSDLFEHPTVAGLARRVSGEVPLRKQENRPSPAPPEGPRAEPLSFAQQRLWLTDLLTPGSALYNVTLAVRLAGSLAEVPLLWSLAEIVRRHEPLRTIFPRGEGEPVQVVLPPPGPSGLAVSRIDLSSLPDAKREAACREAIRREAVRPFDLAYGPVARFLLLRLGSREHVLLVNVHHIAADGWSMSVLFEELAALYRAFLAGRPSPLPEPPLRYADFARWQRSELEGEALQRQLAWWRRELSGVPALELPTDRPRPALIDHRGASRPFVPPPDLAERLRILAPAEGITLFVALLGGFTALLSRLSGQSDFAVGVPSAGRDRLETEVLIGFFVNTLALRSRLEDDPPFLVLLRRARDRAVVAQANQDVPFDRLVEELQAERDLSRSPLFQVMFAFLAVPPMDVRLPGLDADLLDIETTTAKFDLTLGLHEREGLLGGWMEYRTDLFDAATIDRFLGHLTVLLEGAVADPGRPVSELPLLTAAERLQLLVEGNRTDEPLPRERLFHEILEERARRTPDAPALSFGGEVLSYGELNARANRLARHLRAAGAGPEGVVGICLERSLDLVVAVLAVLKAGGAYLPLDPSHPPALLAFMLEAAAARLLVTRGDALPNLGGGAVPPVLLDRDAEAVAAEDGADLGLDLDPRHLAYVLYTSGSTGHPKGVAVSHLGVANLAATQARRFGIGPADRTLQFAPLSFDASVSEMVMTWWAGAELCLARPEEMLPGEPLVELLKIRRITCVTLPPSSLAVLPPVELPDLRVLIVAGEACPPDLVGRWAPGRRLFNGYGPTEVTVGATVGPVAAGSPRLPLGRPIANVRVYVLDRHLEPAPPGVAGEILLAGPGLARGYLGRPDLTAERFIPDPFGGEPGGRLYRTGDLGRRLSDGEMEFLGRMDQQVKIRGIRIEPGEIEAALRQHAEVREAAVVAVRGSGGEVRLVAYIVAGDRDGLSADLRGHLRGLLPEAMVPTRFVRLDALPRTPSGKVDRKALPAPQDAAERGGAWLAPRTELERAIAAVWQEVLGVPRIGVHDNFFESGGSSLLIAKLHSRLKSAVGLDIPVLELFRYPTIEALARKLAEEPRPEAPQEKLEAVRARTRGRQEALRQMNQARAKRRGRDE